MHYGSRSLDDPKTIGSFCQGKFSTATFYNLQLLGRAPRVTDIGGKKLIFPEDEADWVEDIRRNPIKGGVRRAAEAAQAAKKAEAA